MGGYVGPAASKWFASGGLILPMFVPPVTPEWTREMKQQHPAKKKRQHWSKFTSIETHPLVSQTSSGRALYRLRQAALSMQTTTVKGVILKLVDVISALHAI
jgi:hypothetical protein